MFNQQASYKNRYMLNNGGSSKGKLCLLEKKNGEYILIDEMEFGHLGCEYGEFDC